ncbi:hypothetical protein CAPTEDRAFT_223590 [Capitella teleta]|uniref:C2H2-type domain-containing protein n=1 Tax=Capitella teleta TaxID=283909 RepID=R7V2I3_CAPTE|nr:hypothetical protein CAPTEDRAFT_223590 [Capitella teleta]|eukprot:ELU13068.1 hypothetical protein CAPTEDRAFT_223590 [Capitella teleta]
MASDNLPVGASQDANQKRFQCPICNQEFSALYLLRRHYPTHTGERNFSCDICGDKFLRSSALSRHKSVHNSETPFKCSECQKGFKRSTSLHSHMKTHNATKDHVCVQCGKGFHQKVHLVNHMHTHTKQRPFTCKECGAGFNQGANLRVHVQRNHSGGMVQRFICRWCGERFEQRKALRSHELEVHFDANDGVNIHEKDEVKVDVPPEEKEEVITEEKDATDDVINIFIDKESTINTENLSDPFANDLIKTNDKESTINTENLSDPFANDLIKTAQSAITVMNNSKPKRKSTPDWALKWMRGQAQNCRAAPSIHSMTMLTPKDFASSTPVGTAAQQTGELMTKTWIDLRHDRPKNVAFASMPLPSSKKESDLTFSASAALKTIKRKHEPNSEAGSPAASALPSQAFKPADSVSDSNKIASNKLLLLINDSNATQTFSSI